MLAGEQVPRLPLPPVIVSNGEYTPPKQSRELRHYQTLLTDRAAEAAPRHGQTADRWLASPIGMANAFAALNEVFTPHFTITDNEASLAPGMDSGTAFIADESGDPLRIENNRLGEKIRRLEKR